MSAIFSENSKDYFIVLSEKANGDIKYNCGMVDLALLC